MDKQIPTQPDPKIPIPEPYNPEFSNPKSAFPPPRFMSKKMAIILLVLLTIVLIVPLVVFGVSKLTTPAPTPAPAAIITPKLEASPDPTAGWQIYTFENLYSIKYPKDWVSLQNEGLARFFPPGTEIKNGLGPDTVTDYVGITVVAVSSSPESCLGDCPKIDKKFVTKVDGLNADGYEQTQGAVGGNTSHRFIRVIVAKDNLFYSIEFHSSSLVLSKNQKEIFNQMLSTFKFTNTSDNTASWRTYVNSFYGFSLKYPEDWSMKDQGSNNKSEFAILESPSGYSLNMELAENTNFKSSEDYLNFKKATAAQRTTVDGVPAYSYSSYSEGPMPVKGYYNWLMLWRDNKEYTIYLLSPSKSEESLMKQIISTIKFTQ